MIAQSNKGMFSPLCGNISSHIHIQCTVVKQFRWRFLRAHLNKVTTCCGNYIERHWRNPPFSNNIFVMCKVYCLYLKNTMYIVQIFIEYSTHYCFTNRNRAANLPTKTWQLYVLLWYLVETRDMPMPVMLHFICFLTDWYKYIYFDTSRTKIPHTCFLYGSEIPDGSQIANTINTNIRNVSQQT